jgi:dihydropteroate synthase
MGIVNVTPDSFFDGGQHNSPASAIAHAMRLLEEGADMLDIGGESTRPGAASVDAEQELARVIPVLEGLRVCGVALSVDTSKSLVMRAAIQAGVDMINDVNALRAEGALQAVAESQVAVCLMHMQGEPRSMQQRPQYENVVTEVQAFMLERIAMAQAAGIEIERIVIDPGFGFGKTFEHNFLLLRHLDSLCELGVPLLAGLSRKSMLGALTGLSLEKRMLPSVAAAVVAAMKGARIIRVHDVKETRQALQIVSAMENAT